MQLEAIREPVRYRLKTGEEFTLRPGVPTELPDPAATQLLKKAPDKVRRVDPLSSIQPGSFITWERADLTVCHGLVDFLHTDSDGTIWAFITLSGGNWAALNTKFVTSTEEGDPHVEKTN